MSSDLTISSALAILWSMAAVLLLAALGALLALVFPGGGGLLSVGVIEALAFLVCSGAVLKVHSPSRPAQEALGLRPTPWGLVSLAALAGIALHGPTEACRAWVESWAPTPEAELLRRASVLDVQSFPSCLALLIVAGGIAPVVEESFARGALFGPLCRRYGAIGAAGISAFCFVVVHFWDWRAAFGMLLAGALLGYWRVISGSLLPCIMLHVSFNATTVVALSQGWASPTRPMYLGLFGTLTSCVAIGILMTFAYRIAQASLTAKDARREDVQ